jgi:hypothetical protein
MGLVALTGRRPAEIFFSADFERVGFLNQPLDVFPARTLKVIDGLNVLKTHIAVKSSRGFLTIRRRE